jgi:hypothetical protein
MADVRLIVGVSAVNFEHVVAGGPAVTGFPAVEGILVVASVPADPATSGNIFGLEKNLSIQCFSDGICLAGGFTYWIVE